jgi:hypothetical protein
MIRCIEMEWCDSSRGLAGSDFDVRCYPGIHRPDRKDRQAASYRQRRMQHKPRSETLKARRRFDQMLKTRAEIADETAHEDGRAHYPKTSGY